MRRFATQTRTALAAGLGAVLATAALAGIAGAQQEPRPPTVREVPTIQGEAREGQTLTATRGEWRGRLTSSSRGRIRCRRVARPVQSAFREG
jgi:hypothetical protein